VRAAKLAVDKGIGIDMCVYGYFQLVPFRANSFTESFFIHLLSGILFTYSFSFCYREAGLDLERQAYAPLLFSKDRLEGLAAFAEKRKPVYKGE
jgi:hypothetical protein